MFQNPRQFIVNRQSDWRFIKFFAKAAYGVGYQLRPSVSISPGLVLERHARSQPSHPGLRFEDREYSYGELNEAVNKAAHAFAKLGVQAGDVIALMMDSRPEFWDEFVTRFNIPHVFEIYGATESPIGIINLDSKPGMVGRMMPGQTLVRTLPDSVDPERDAKGSVIPCKVGETGLLTGRITRVSTFDGYLDKSKNKSKIIENAFGEGKHAYNSGDLLKLNPRGYLSFEDRLGDTFRWKGENVATSEVGDLLARHPGVVEATVYGVRVPHNDGRAGMAALVVDDAFNLEAFGVYVADHFPRYSRPLFLRFEERLEIEGLMAEYDYIVIGSGSAGAIVAARLAEDPDVSVLLLEAGGSDRTTLVRKPGMISLVQQVKQLKEKLDWGFSTAPQANLNNRRITYTRGKVVGGSSSVNGMIYLRGNKENYNDWAARGCEGWSFEDVLPFYKKLEDHQDGETEYHGAGGPIRVTRHPEDQLSPVSVAFMNAVSAVCDVPILDDFNAENQNCASMMQMSCRNGVRSGTGEAYVQPSLSRPNFSLEMRALVQRVVIDNGRAVGVEYEQSGKRVVAHANREVILSGGTIGSPHLLMLSGVGPADHLREHGIEVKLDVPGVGRNLHDHLLVPLVFRARTSLHRGTAAHFLGGMIKEYMVGKSWFGRSVFEACAFIKSHPDRPIPDLQLHTLPWGYPDPNQDGPERAHVDTGHCLSVLPTLLYPKSRGEVLLTSPNAADAPHIDPAYLKEPEDLQFLLNGIRKCREICSHPELKEHLGEELTPGADRASDEELIEEIRLRAGTVYHPVGTCKMGIDDMAVVDPRLRVRGIEGLRVVDASIMPQITGSNTNAPSMMIGERAAALIQEA